MSSLLRAKSYDASPVPADLRQLLGSLLVSDWREALIARGFGWHVPVGTLSTPIVGGGNGTVLDADQPELVIDVPTDYAMVPLRFDTSLLFPLLAADNDEVEIAILVDADAISGATATNGTVETPRNMRTNASNGCPLKVVSAVTTNLTAAPGADTELFHRQAHADLQGIAANALWAGLDGLYEPRHPPIIIGPATFVVYFGGTTATSGFISADFPAFPSNLVTGLV